MKTLNQIAADLAGGKTTSRALVEECLAKIKDPAGEGSRTFTKVSGENALVIADMHDALRKRGAAVSPYAGIPLSVKDLFDIAGDVTTAGSKVFADHAPAKADAPAVARLRAAGFVPVGRTNMVEFAFSALGVNPHYGTPKNPYDRATGRIPGGSSSGAAVSLSDGMAHASLGTDTGGSCRLPAAMCGLVGYKPTQKRVPLDGCVPLSTTLDSAGPLGRNVEDCAILDSILAAEDVTALPDVSLAGLRFGIPQTMLMDGLEPYVAQRFEAAVKALEKAGARIEKMPFKEVLEIPQINAKGGCAAPEAYAYHRKTLETKADQYDQRILARINRGKEQDASDYIILRGQRADFIRRVTPLFAAYDAVIMPTTVMTAVPIASLEPMDEYNRVNLALMRNTAIANFIDGCSISIPCHKAGEAPTGFMLTGPHMTDKRILAIGAAVERALANA